MAGLLAGCGGGHPLDVVDEDFSGDRPKPRDYPVHGIDVSKFQGDIDWSKVADSGVKFAWIKASEGGDHADERFQANWEGAKAAGVAHGAYHFVYWCRPPMEEMAFFEQNAPVEADALPPVLDVEATPTSRTCKKHLTQDGAIAQMKVMLEEMERHYGKRPVIYTTVDFYEAILADGAFMDYPIWVRSTKYHPAVRYGSRPWTFWQYQSDAHVAGIGPKVDRNAFFGSNTQWTAFLQEPGIRPGLPKAIETQIAGKTPPPDAAAEPATTASIATETQPAARAEAPEIRRRGRPAPGARDRLGRRRAPIASSLADSHGRRVASRRRRRVRRWRPGGGTAFPLPLIPCRGRANASSKAASDRRQRMANEGAADLKSDALHFHREPRPGKLEIVATKPLANQRDLALAYSPGVAFPCQAIAADPHDAALYTARQNLVAVLTNGTAVLGLGPIGPLAAKPVMEGKAVLFKKFAGIDVFDIEVAETDVEKLVDIIVALEPTFGGINLEDIKGPECFEVEEKAKARMGIPVFHDDQHGTAIIVSAAVTNALLLTGKSIDKVKIVCSGAGAAALASLNLLVSLGAKRRTSPSATSRASSIPAARS